MSRTLLILNADDIKRLSNHQHVALQFGPNRTLVIMSDECHDACERGEYDIEKEERIRRVSGGMLS